MTLFYRMKSCQILVISSLLFFLIPYAISQYREETLDMNEYTFLFLFLAQAIVSVLFWWNPVDGSIIHRIDGRLARTTAIMAIIYLLFYKKFELPIFVYGLFGTFIFAYLSNYHSSREWCSNDHIASHCMFHLIGSLMLGFTMVV